MKLNFIVPKISDPNKYRKAVEIALALSSNSQWLKELEAEAAEALASLKFHSDWQLGNVIVTSEHQTFSCLAHSDASKQNVSLTWHLPLMKGEWSAFWLKKDGGVDVYIKGRLQKREKGQKWER